MKNPLDVVQTKTSRFGKVQSSYIIPSESDDTDSDFDKKAQNNNSNTNNNSNVHMRRKSKSIKLVDHSKSSVAIENLRKQLNIIKL